MKILARVALLVGILLFLVDLLVFCMFRSDFKYILSPIATFSIGLIGSSFVLYWNDRLDRRQQDEHHGALSIEITQENVILVKNLGKVPMLISSVCSITEDFKREKANQKDLIANYYELKRKVDTQEDIAHRDMSLCVNDAITLTLEQTGLNLAIEEYDLVLQVIKIEYAIRDDIFVKYFGICRLTSTYQKFLYDLSQKATVNQQNAFGVLSGLGKYYPIAIYPRFIYEHARQIQDELSSFKDESGLFKDPLGIFQQESDISKSLKSYSTYEDINKIRTCIPTDKWYIFRIEDEE